MGSLYRPTYRGTDGTLKESAIIWLKYRDALGVLRREASGTDKEQEARRLLRQREGAAVEGRVVVPRADRVTIAELAENLKADYAANGRKSADRLAFSLARLLPVFGARKAITLTSADVTAYRVQRQAAGAAAATVNRELAALKRMFSLAVKGERLQRMPSIEMLREDNARRDSSSGHNSRWCAPTSPNSHGAPRRSPISPAGGSRARFSRSSGDRWTSVPAW